MKSTKYHQRVLAHLKHQSYEPSTLERMATDLGVDAGDQDAFAHAVEQLQEEGQLVVGDRGLISLPPIGAEVIGVFRKNERGFGFIIPHSVNEHGDLFVPAHAVGDAVTGDVVRAVVHERKQRRGGRDDGKSPFTGEVTEIIERGQANVGGTLEHRDGLWIVEPDGKVFTNPVVVSNHQEKNARAGDKVIVEIVNYPDNEYLADGVITKVLGEAGMPNVETQAIIETYNLPGEFPKRCVDEAREHTRTYEQEMDAAIEQGKGFDPSVRNDLRDTHFIFTIDPPDAKDYDDAISIERLDDVYGDSAPADDHFDRTPGGGAGKKSGSSKGGRRGWRLGVHIADVSHFVTQDSALDQEAQHRGNSCYLPRLVIPMLPEVLSNGICSLQELVPRYAKSAFIDYDERGRVVRARFSATVIHSRKRMTYLEAQALIDGRSDEEARKHARNETPYTDELRSALKDANALSKAIWKRRHEAGMIHLDLPDVELLYDEEGRVVDAEPEDDAYTHTLIEMFMVEANEAVARLFEDLDVPLIRRTHPEPVPGKMDSLKDMVKVAGYRIPKNPTREEIQGLLDATAGTPAAPAIHFAILRTMTKAEYAPAHIGHFALASGAYAHFTSPIRRYTDLTAHRSLNAFLKRTDNGREHPTTDKGMEALGKKLKEDPLCPPIDELKRISSRCNYTEQNATDAERELRQFLVLQLLEEHIGGEFEGVVTGVSNRGAFVQLQKYLAEGLCKTEDLPVPTVSKGKASHYKKGFWKLDQKTGALVEQNSGRSIAMGDRVRVTVLAIDLSRRQMELGISDASSRDRGKSKRVDPKHQDVAAGRAEKAGAPSDASGEQNLAAALKIGDVEFEQPKKTGSQKRSQRSKSRDKRKKDFRDDRKGKGKRQ